VSEQAVAELAAESAGELVGAIGDGIGLVVVAGSLIYQGIKSSRQQQAYQADSSKFLQQGLGLRSDVAEALSAHGRPICICLQRAAGLSGRAPYVARTTFGWPTCPSATPASHSIRGLQLDRMQYQIFKITNDRWLRYSIRRMIDAFKLSLISDHVAPSGPFKNASTFVGACVTRW
jgi:hypothetical protein